VGDGRLNNLEQVILKPQNLPEQLELLAGSLPAQGRPTIPNPTTMAYQTELLPGKILQAS